MTQFFEVHPKNPQPRLIRHAALALANGLAVYPTDSYYALGFLAGNTAAAARVRLLRGLDDSHLFTMLCRDLGEIGRYGAVDTAAFRVIKQRTPGAYTFVLAAAQKVPRHLRHPRRKTVAFRVPAHPVARALLTEAGEPIITTTLRLRGDAEPLSPSDFRARLAGVADVVLDAGPCDMTPTTVIDFSEPEPRLLRRGGGAVDEDGML
ncbi:MAG: threonylcarbamoyl-AMP synthase [Betaproteobacteria bacterium]|nr:threonylcarbamoyl-AMP synthase [Betaproteobacteria bacterium]